MGFIVVWKITPLFAEWIANPTNVLFQSGLLNTSSHILELGCGISGIIGLVTAPKVGRYFATDQDYVLKTLRENLKENETVYTASKLEKRSRKSKQTSSDVTSNIDCRTLDWETDSFSNLYHELGLDPSSEESIDVIIACDCIYNSHLVDPLVNTCAEICRLAPVSKPTLCVVAQQLRSPEVFEEWLNAFYQKFKVWRVPDELLVDGLKEESGFVMHFGLLKENQEK